ncbi:putative mitochondrial carrier (TC 2.A.29) family protein [Lyophyllum shimeji]|uniref:Mitochondrial carrier (TC 2.A.29) family protein n=1 Tax=Lyophyllum shimeji TaxID=47721 RepID=A0A9P3UMN1_LYOSH|nr:putative mitochondrial carrier (TC 2.A.29) family protein [Lyophyllum shimeji]
MSHNIPEIASYFIAGGCAGAASRTVVSPLERLKIIQQVQPRTSDGQYKGVWRSLVRMWKEEGFKGFMRGNGINCLRIVPYRCVPHTFRGLLLAALHALEAAVQFTTYEQLKKFFTRHGSKELDTPKRLASGALAGITSVCSTYPLDLVRSRLSIATASVALAAAAPSASSSSAASTSANSSSLVNPLSQPSTSSASIAKPAAALFHTTSPTHAASTAAVAKYTSADLTIAGMTLKIMREEGGVRGLYRGLITTAVGVAPYVGINFAAYEFLRGIITPPGKSSVTRKLTCGALAGTISQTLTYPFDVLRRKMQVTGMKGGSVKYNGALHALRSIIQAEGVAGLYRGLWPNLLKVAPSIATSFFTYELVKELLIPPS